MYVGRRVVYLPAFTPEAWVAAAAAESITHAMVVPTMLGRVLDVHRGDRRAAAGAAPPVVRRRADAGRGHRAGAAAAAGRRLRQRLRADRDELDDVGARSRRPPRRDRPATTRRCAAASGRSAGRTAPSRCRSATRSASRSSPASPARSGCAATRCRASTPARPATATDGWFPTRDGGWIDEGGYLFVEGRLDDVIVRGGENISPGEIEDVIRTHAGVADVAVVGVSSQEWGEDIVAFVVATDPAPDEAAIQAYVRERAALVEGPGPRRVPRRAALQRDRQAAAPRPQGRRHPAVDLTRASATLGAHVSPTSGQAELRRRRSGGHGRRGLAAGRAASAGGRWSPR